MSYQVLARKWRPHTFETLIGQDHVVKALKHALSENRLHHAYLFTGTRGVGKTTISRILAKCLNCKGADGNGGITAEPCGVCEACRAIDEDRFVDYIEMDAASTRGIDDMVALLERAKYAPTNARFKVYMIDEVHQLTTPAFNAMLKTLEEPPEYVKFILATTDPQKVPVTVLSRCLQFNLKSLSPTVVAQHMADVLNKENIPYDDSALKILAVGAKGSMRDGLSLLDQAIAFSSGNVTQDSVREMLGTIDTTTLIRLLYALANRDAKAVIEIADEIGERSLSYTQAMKDLSLLLHRIAMAQLIPDSVAEDEMDREAILELARIFQSDEVQLYYQIAIHGRNDLHLAPDEYAGFTMALIRMMAFAPYDGRVPKSVPEEFSKTKASEEKISSQSVIQPKSASKVLDKKEAVITPTVEKQEEPILEVKTEPVKAEVKNTEIYDINDIPPWEDDEPYVADDSEYIEDDPGVSLQSRKNESFSRGEPLAPIKMDAWLDVAQKIKLDPETQALIINAELHDWTGRHVILGVPEHLRRLTEEKARIKEIENSMNQILENPVNLMIEVGNFEGRTLVNLERQKYKEEIDRSFAKMSADKTVQKFAEVFNAKLDKSTFKLFDENGVEKVSKFN
ncbi:MAG: DNA polymerase III subunit gamma/tau [Burkholderiaceae bacterium]|nr:DNA polymerase III subunit gamma/tau [Burkholderiaceae bacterium]